MVRSLFSLRTVLLVLALAMTLFAQDQATPRSQVSQGVPRSAPGAFAVEENILYASVSGSELRLDIYKPKTRPHETRPAVILIHGGGWTSFDKSIMRGMGEYLASAGFVVFSIDYRLFNGKENRWPSQLDDVQFAIRWVRANAEKYAVDPEHIGAFGHSAGAQLAALVGMEDTRDKSASSLAKYSSRVQAVVDVSGPSDFTTAHDPEELAFLTSFFGTDYATHPEVWREASPVFHISKKNAPFLIMHGTQDQNVPITQAQELFDRLRAAGVHASFVKVNDVHTFQTPEARRQMATETLEFFARYLIVAPVTRDDGFRSLRRSP